METIKGIAVSPGIAIGTAVRLAEADGHIAFRTVEPDEVAAEIRRVDDALAASARELQDLRTRTAARAGEQAAAIFDFHMGLLTDRTLVQPIHDDIERERVAAEYAVSENFRKFADRLRATGSEMFVQKASDVVDLENRVLARLTGGAIGRISRASGPVVVIGHELTPSQAADLHRAHAVAFATDAGGLTGHTSILARALGMPAVVGCMHVSTDVEDGDQVIVDGDAGVVIVRPDASVVERYRAAAAQGEQRRRALRDIAKEPSVTLDGVKIDLLGNIEFPDEIEAVFTNGGSGTGLYRTEFLHLTSATTPTEEDHFDAYRRALELSRGAPLVIRTLDLGADKFTQDHLADPERNPFLGLRSIRYCLRHPQLFKTQLRAILRASALGPIKVMFPLVSSVMELRQTHMIINDLREELEDDGIAFDPSLATGIMVETPAAALMTRVFANEVSFVSIGTNDLIQYTLAVDRGNEQVASLYSAANPAVLTLVKNVVRAARHAGIGASLCGEVAGNPLFTPLLIGFGLRSLSMSPVQIPVVKRVVRALDIERCETLARKVGSFDSDRQVLSYLRDELRRIDPEALVNAGAD
jgi:phosphotransferase system enzyme I (PtsI)